MDEDTAYKLGRLDFPSFYDIVSWKVNKEPFDLAAFFDWTVPGGFGGWPLKCSGGDVDWENITAGGHLKFDLIREIPHKLAYIRGRLASYSVRITETSIDICYANSYKSRDFLAQCLYDVIFDKCVLLPPTNQPHECDLRRVNPGAPKFTIEKGEILGTIPGTPFVKLTAAKEVIDFLVGEEKEFRQPKERAGNPGEAADAPNEAISR